jgi:hypothetical protein
MKGRKNVLGYKPSLETLAKLRESQIDKTHSEEAIGKMREVWADRKFKTVKSLELIANKLNSYKLDSDSRTLTRKIGKLVIVTNIDSNVSSEYSSIIEAALTLNITRTTLRSYIKNKTVFTLLRTSDSSCVSDDKSVIKERYIIIIKDK